MSDEPKLKNWAIYTLRGSHLGSYRAKDEMAAYTAHVAVMGYPSMEAARKACRDEKTVEGMLKHVKIVEIPPIPEVLEAMRTAPAMSEEEYALAPRTEAWPSSEMVAEADGYTPGPWSACHQGECRCRMVWSGDGRYVVAIAVDADKPHLETIHGGEGVVAAKTLTANARLIAAAPTLLKALRLARAFIGAQEAPPEGLSYDDAMLLGTLAEAEAKATGRSLSDVIGEPSEAPEA